LSTGVSIQFKGIPQLQRRLDAIGELGSFMRDLALSAVGEEKRLSPVRTGNLRRTIHVARVSAREAVVEASANYAAFVEFGTRPHEIRPRNRKALRWKSGGAYRFARVVQHPGTRAQPYMIPGAEKAISGAGGLADHVVNNWNNAA
jgi:hypothetical protein